MSIVAPNGTVRFLSGVPIDEDYQNSLDFLSKELQTAYFLGLTPIHTLSNATRVRDGVIRVDVNSDAIMNCNYIMFQNLDFWNKWFYAFITNVEYVNNSCCYVYYAIDDIQTWMFDVELEECFVEREHTTTDALFEHLVDEGFGSNEYVNSDIATNELDYSVFDAILFTSYDPRNLSQQGETIPDVAPMQGNLNGLLAIDFGVQNNQGEWLPITERDPANWNSMNPLEKLSCYTREIVQANQKDAIVGLILVPRDMINDVNTSYPKEITLSYTNYAVGESLNGYVPKNKKLYNSPYCMMEIGTSDGQKEYLQPEFLPTGTNTINVYPSISPSSSFLVVPTGYRGDNKAWDKSISFNGFPQCALSIDGYSAWVASGGTINTEHNMFKGIIGGLATMGTGNVGGGVMQIADAVLEKTLTTEQAKRLPDTEKGSVSASPLFTNNQLRIYQRRKTIKSDVAKSIDDYFTMYGYKINKIKVPSRRNRPHYTFVKTKGCKINGGAPADAINRIQTIYDNGIRFWVNASEVGHYTDVDNSPV